jgi:hypothetical protein
MQESPCSDIFLAGHPTGWSSPEESNQKQLKSKNFQRRKDSSFCAGVFSLFTNLVLRKAYAFSEMVSTGLWFPFSLSLLQKAM